MPKPALYRQWITKNQRAGQPLEATYLVYIYKELLTKAGLTKRYTRKDALAELHEVLADALDGFAGSLPERIKEATKAKLQEDGAADPDGEAPEGTPAQRRASVSRASVSRAQEDEGSLASGSTRSLDKYKGEVQFGDLELRGILLDVGRNPDLGADKDEKAEKDLKDDALQWGVARASRSTKLDGKSLDAFRAAPPASEIPPPAGRRTHARTHGRPHGRAQVALIDFVIVDPPAAALGKPADPTELAPAAQPSAVSKPDQPSAPPEPDKLSARDKPDSHDKAAPAGSSQKPDKPGKRPHHRRSKGSGSDSGHR